MPKAPNCAQHPVETPQVKEFYSAIYRPEGPVFELIPSAKAVTLPGYEQHEFFLYNETKHFENQPIHHAPRSEGKWTVVHAKSGQAIGRGSIKAKALESSLNILARVYSNGLSIEEQTIVMADRVGLSPRYDAPSAEVQ